MGFALESTWQYAHAFLVVFTYSGLPKDNVALTRKPPSRMLAGTAYLIFNMKPPFRHSAIGGISGASAVSPADIWTVTDGGVARWNGRSWRRVTLASKLGTGLLLDSVVARCDRNVWVAGLAANARGGNSGTAMHWNGAAWKSVQVGRPTSQTSTLASMVPDGHGGIWALNVPDLGSWQPWHFTGGRWLRAVTHIASPGQVTGMSSGLALVPGSTSVWGVGGRGAYPDGKGMIFLDGRVPR